MFVNSPSADRPGGVYARTRTPCSVWVCKKSKSPTTNGYAKLINDCYVSAEGKLFSAKISATTRRPRFQPKFRPPHGDPDIPPNFGHHAATQLRSVSFSFRVRSVFVSFRFDSKLFPPTLVGILVMIFRFNLFRKAICNKTQIKFICAPKQNKMIFVNF